MSVRDADPRDVDDIGRMIRALAEYERLEHEVVWSADELAAALFGPEAVPRVLIAEDDTSGEAAGFALWFPSFSTFLGRPGIWLEDLFVWPEHRGRGHGVALLAHFQERVGDGRLEWTVLDWNEPSIAFYRSMGARPVDGWIRYRWLADEVGAADDVA